MQLRLDAGKETARKAPRWKMTIFTRLFLGHLLLAMLLLALVSLGFRYYMARHIYNAATGELNSYANVLARTAQKTDEPPQTALQSAQLQAVLGERKISFVLMSKTGDVIAKDQRTMDRQFRSKSFTESLKAYINRNGTGDRSFTIEQNTPDPLIVLPRIVKLKGHPQNQAYLFVMAPERGLNETLRRVNQAALFLLLPALLLAVAISWLLSRSMSRSVQTLRQATRRIAAGGYDVRAEVRRSDELGDLSRDFNSMAAQLEEASAKLAEYERNRRGFLTDVTHELRTPLTSIRGIIEGLKNDWVTDPAEQQKYYAIIEKETFRLIRLINELLDMEKIENGLMELRYGEYSLRDLLDVAAESLEVLAAGKLLKIIADCPDQITFAGDYDRMLQIVLNLVKNSIQFTSGGSIRLTGSETATHTVIHVADTGQGMSREELGRIWERFYKADPSRAKLESETGLGLPIVKRLVEAHRGTITVQSEPGIGTTFTVMLPKPAGG